MKILYHIPSLDTIYAGRTIYVGYQNAFQDLGHDFRPLTAASNQQEVFREFVPDILITSLTPYSLKYLDVESVRQARKKGMKVFVNMPFWNSPLSRLRVNETPSLRDNRDLVSLIQSGTFGDFYYNICEQNDERMKGFAEMTGNIHHTILLAADKLLHFPDYAKHFRADISYIGTYLPEKRDFIREAVYPLQKKYDVKLYGQDWTLGDRAKGFTQKVGQYFNVPFVRSLQKPKLQLEDERKIYTSSTISVNIHEDHQKKYGGDCNERTFKIPACGGFEITDDVACIRKYFIAGQEIIIAESKDDWFQKIAYYINNPQERIPIIEAGRKKVLAHHTYHNRAEQMLRLAYPHTHS